MKCSLLLLRICTLSLASFVLLSKPQKCYAQSPELPSVISSTSPTPAGLSRYIDFPVSLSNGIPDISIPIYTLSSSRLKVPISLSYHAGGIKVMDRTSTMGLGWTLSAGGAINRVIHGLPDELAPGNMVTNGGWLNTVWPTDVVGYGYTLSQLNDNEICVSNHLYNSYITDHHYDGLWDGEPDIFYFSAPGIGGKFLYRNSPDASGQRAVVIPYQPIKISNPGSTPGFTITGSDGVVYEFGGVIDLNTVDKTGSNPNNAASAWHLTKMISADGTDQVTFIYGLGTTFDVTKVPSSSIKAHYEAPNGNINPPPSDPSGLGDRATVTTPANASSSMEQSSVLTEIITKNADIVFNYSTLSVSMKPLQSIDVYSITNGIKQKIKTYTFTINQFAGGGANSLRLDAVTEVGYEKGVAVSNPPYKINYLSADAPPYDSKAQDLWGYYNGQIYNTDLTMVNAPITGSTIQFAPEKRTPDETSMKKGMIQSITYPTGGTSTFTFDPNQITASVTSLVPANTTTSVQSLLTMGTVPADPGQSQTDVTFIMPSPPAWATVKSYTLTFSGQITSGCTPGNGHCTTNSPRVVLVDVTSGITVFDHTLTLLQQGSQSSEYYTTGVLQTAGTAPIPGHQCRLYFVNQGSPSTSSLPLYVLSANLTQYSEGYQTQTQTQNILAGGLRIKQIEHFDPVTNKTLLKTYNYTQPYFTCPSVFAGDYLDFFRKNLAKSKWTLSPLGGGRTSPSDPLEPKYISNIYYLESPTFPVGGSGSTSVAYQEVEEYQTDKQTGNSLGKTVYTFNTASDYIPARLPTIRFDNEEVRKQLKSTKIYKTGDFVNPVKEIINDYTNVDTGSPETPGSDNIKMFIASSDFDFANRQNPASSGIWSATGCPIYEKDIPFLLIGLYYNVSRNFLSSTTTRDYNGTAYTTITTNYTYGNYAHMQPTQITTTDSKSQLKTQSISYPLDFANITGTSNDAVGIKNLQNLHVITTPIEKSSYVTNTSNVKQLTSSVFTTYHPTLPLPAQISVAEFTVPPTNFVFASVTGGNVVKDSRYQPRLSFAYDATTGNITEQQKVNDVKEVYLWGYNGQYPVAKILNTTSLIASSKVAQNILDNPTTDEALRTELNKLRSITDAKVTTYTYGPLIGPISETDPSGKTTYYEYDGFNRLKNIKDYQSNIVKNFQYNYQNSCGTNCIVLPMQTFTSYNTPGYPVGVFNSAKQYIGIANNAAEYVTLWNSNAANQAIGTLAVNSNSLKFNLTTSSGTQVPSGLFGLRFYKLQQYYGSSISIFTDELCYVDYGDGSAAFSLNNRIPVEANTLIGTFNNGYAYTSLRHDQDGHYCPAGHNYSVTGAHTITVFHNETSESVGFQAGDSDDNSHQYIISGNYPQLVKCIFNGLPTSSDIGVVNFSSLREVIKVYYDIIAASHNSWQSITNFHKLKWAFIDFAYASEIMSNITSNFPLLQTLDLRNSDISLSQIFSTTGFSNGYYFNFIPGVNVTSSDVDLLLQKQAAVTTQTNGYIGIAGYPTPGRTHASDAAYSQLSTAGWNMLIGSVQ